MEHTVLDMGDSDDSSESRLMEMINTNNSASALISNRSHDRISPTDMEDNKEERVGVFDYTCVEPKNYGACDSLSNFTRGNEKNNKHGDHQRKTSSPCAVAKDNCGSDNEHFYNNAPDKDIEMKTVSSHISSSEYHKSLLSGDNMDYLYEKSLISSGQSPATSSNYANSRDELNLQRTHRRLSSFDDELSSTKLSHTTDDTDKSFGSTACGGYDSLINRSREVRLESKRSSSHEYGDITSNVELDDADRSILNKTGTSGYEVDNRSCRRSASITHDGDTDYPSLTSRAGSSGDHGRSQDEPRTYDISSKIIGGGGGSFHDSHTVADIAHRGRIGCGSNDCSRSGDTHSTEQSIELHRRAMRKRQRKERRAGSYHKAEEHPEYKGDRPLDELLDFINEGQGRGNKSRQVIVGAVTSDAGKEKNSKRKKKLLENDPESSSNSVRSESLSRSATDDQLAVGTSDWKNTTQDDSFLYRSSKELSEMKAISNLSVKTESNDNISETESIAASLQDCCLSDGGIDMTSSSYNDKEFTTVNKKKRVKGVEATVSTVRNIARKRNDFKTRPSFSNPQGSTSFKDAPQGGSFEGTVNVGEKSTIEDMQPLDQASAHVPVRKNEERVVESRRATNDVTSNTSEMGFSYAKAVGESSTSFEADGTFSQSAFPDLQPSSTSNTGGKLRGGTGVSSFSEPSAEKASKVASTRDYPISYASMAAAAKAQAPKRWGNSASGNSERERRHSFDSGATEIFPNKARADLLKDDMSVNNAEEFPPITGRSVAGSAHTLGALDRKSNVAKAISNGKSDRDNDTVQILDSGNVGLTQNQVQQMLQNGTTSASSDTSCKPFEYGTVAITEGSVPDEVNTGELISKVKSKSEVGDAIQENCEINKHCSEIEATSIHSHSAIECTTEKPGVNQTPAEGSCCSSSLLPRTQIPREPVIFLDKGREKFETLSQNFEISFGFDVDCAGDYRSSDYTSITGGVASRKCISDSLSASGKLASQKSSTSHAGKEMSATVNAGGEGAASNCVPPNSTEDGTMPSHAAMGTSVPCRDISSPLPGAPYSPSSSHSRPIALMSTTSPSQLARTPVGVVPPLNRSPAAKVASDSKLLSTDQSFKKTVSACRILELVKMFKPNDAGPNTVQRVNSCAMSVGRKNGKFDLFGAQVFLYKGFEDTFSADNQCLGSIVHYRAKEEIS